MNYFSPQQFLSKIYFHAVGVLGLKNQDVILTSFPKSGNTWVRFFFCNLISLIYWDGKVVNFKILDETMPEFGVNNLLNSWEYKVLPRIVKTHKSYLTFFSGKKTILIMRDPRDVMVSYYYFSSNKKTIDFDGSFSEFIRHKKLGLESWFCYHKSWDNIDKETFLYEDLKNNEEKEFFRMLSFLEISLPESMISEALILSRFEKVKHHEEKTKHYKEKENKEGFTFTRKGSVGDWINYFSEQDLSYYNTLVDEYRLENFPYTL